MPGKMLPDSSSVNSYKQKSDELKYMLQFGVAPFMRSAILNELKGLPFSFRFDETTTSEVQKQYEAYATYNSRHFGRIVTLYIHYYNIFRNSLCWEMYCGGST